MTYFQVLCLVFLGLLLLAELAGWLRAGGNWKLRLLRCGAWVLTAVAIARPEWIGMAAAAIGIGRGADLVLYLFVLAFLVLSFYFYAKYLRLQRQITELVRQQAIREAQRGGDRSPHAEHHPTTMTHRTATGTAAEPLIPVGLPREPSPQSRGGSGRPSMPSCVNSQ